ncbi:MAG: winged helix-turn-helix transcriptional regulator [Chloroflexi bacterium]|jgi:DNA-binding transcriptional ArsR family regulator|nr:winged helix-turn-helix transcriptional regulator [Chloroflexota bacterium]MBT7290588.1 winged helix-turn-helix transcriptional regulator [Chloroflexota bacterium]
MDKKTQRSEIDYEFQAEMLSVLANPKRLMIIHILGEDSKTVGEIAAELGISLQNASQHLRIMKDRGILVALKEGQTVRYSLTTPVLCECCDRVRDAMLKLAEARGKFYDQVSSV